MLSGLPAVALVGGASVCVASRALAVPFDKALLALAGVGEPVVATKPVTELMSGGRGAGGARPVALIGRLAEWRLQGSPRIRRPHGRHRS